jgi:PAS domain S-box-containing protein
MEDIMPEKKDDRKKKYFTELEAARKLISEYDASETLNKRAKQKLVESVALLNSFFNSPGAMRGVVEVEGNDIRHIADNAITAEFFERTQETMSNMLASEMGVDKGFIELWIKHYEESKNKKQQVNFEYDHKVDNQSHFFAVTVNYLGESDRGFSRYTYVLFDITEHKQAQKELQKAHDELDRRVEQRTAELAHLNEQLKEEIKERKQVEEAIQLSKADWVSTFDAISDWVSLIDLEYKIVRSNRAGEKLLKISTEETIGRTCCDLVHGTAEPISGCPMQKMLETNQRESLDLYVEEMKRWLRILVDPMMDEHGNVVRAVHIVRDITESKQKEEALHQSEERLSLATETANLVIWEWHFDTGVVYSSSEKFFEITGLTREETQNFSLDLWLGKVHLDDRKWTEEKLQALFRGETESAENELRVRHPKKGWIWLYGVGLVVERDKHGKPIRIVGAHRDITDRKQAEEEREKLINELQKALKEIKTLRGILPLCSHCKKIRDDKGYWKKVDVYIHQHTEADISHGICPDCAEKYYPEYKLFDD